MHPRQAIREAIVAALDTVPTFTGRVDTNRARPTSLAELPRVIVYTLSETSEQVTLSGFLSRVLQVGVEVRTTATDDLDDALDELCELAESAFSVDPYFGGKAVNSYLSGTAIGLDGEGESRQAIATLTYTVTYASSPNFAE